MTNGELGATGQKIYDFIRDTHAATGLVPSVREIRAAIGVSSIGTVGYWLDRLEALNLIRRDAGKNRSIQLRGESPTVPVPLVGEIRAGSPILAEERVDGNFALPRQLVGEGTLFMLRVRGDSMIDAGILEGDVVVVRRQETARNGEIVVALAGDDETTDEATVKTFYREAGRVRLQPENAALEPIYAEHVQILGKVTGVFREL